MALPNVDRYHQTTEDPFITKQWKKAEFTLPGYVS